MKEKIKQAILPIVEEKRRNGDVLPFATSIEVAHLLNMNALEVEELGKDIEGMAKGKTLITNTITSNGNQRKGSLLLRAIRSL